MTGGPFAPLHVVPLKERSSVMYAGQCNIDVIDGAFVMIDAEETRTHVPVGGFSCIMLEPGARITHAAVTLAARLGTLLIWIGEGGVRTYSAGHPGGARVERLLHQAKLALDPELRLKVVRRMFGMRFKEAAPEKRSIEQLRGIEGTRVKTVYQMLAKQHKVPWKGRSYDQESWESADLPKICLSAATSCMHGIAEAAIVTSGYSPSIGFLHGAIAGAFVFDIADLFKLETVVPIAFDIAGRHARGQLHGDPEGNVRRACRDAFRRTDILGRIIPAIEEALMVEA